MSEINQELVAKYVDAAKAVNCKVVEVSSQEDILNYLVSACAEKTASEMLYDEPNTEKGPLGPNKMPTRVKKVIAAPTLDDEAFASLKAKCDEKGFICIRDHVRDYAAGIDIGMHEAICAIAASGTCMCETTNEDTRLSGMISETSVVVVKKSTVYPDLSSVAQIMREALGKGPEGHFISLISGPSRTADIECVGAIGVHGPLEMHVLLMEG